ncbi:hypothetical protein WUBG_03804, partial [Wuchereria bancrofti]
LRAQIGTLTASERLFIVDLAFHAVKLAGVDPGRIVRESDGDPSYKRLLKLSLSLTV